MCVAVSIVVPIYNTEKYLEECLESLKNQDFDDYEVILVNDGSTDGSLRICEKYLQNENFKLISQENGGPAKARNTGIIQAAGKYITFVDSDDFVTVDYCRSLYDLMEQYDLDVCAASFKTFREPQGDILFEVGENVFNARHSGSLLNKAEFLSAYVEEGLSLILSWGKMYKMSIFKDNAIFFPEGWLYEESVLTLEVYGQAKRFYILNRVLYSWRLGKPSITNNHHLKPKNISHEFTQYIKKLEILFELSCIDRSCKEKGRANFSDELIRIFLRYQREAVASIAITNGGGSNQIFIFPASAICANYIEILKSNCTEISVVDNDASKRGAIFHSTPIIHFSELKARGIKESETVLIASHSFFIPIYKQLFDNGIVSSFADVMPYKGQNAIEQEYVKGFEKLYAFWYGK